MADQNLPINPSAPDAWDLVYVYYDAERLGRMRDAVATIIGRLPPSVWAEDLLAAELDPEQALHKRASNWQQLLNNLLQTFLSPQRAGGVFEVYAAEDRGSEPTVTLSYVFLRLSAKNFLMLESIDFPSPLDPDKFAEAFTATISEFLKLKKNLRHVENINTPEIGPGKGPAVPPA